MAIELKNGQCVELRSASSSELETVVDLLNRSGLPTAGVADSRLLRLAPVTPGEGFGE